MTWSLLSPFGVQRDASGTVWHAGRVMDVLCVQDDVLLIGAQTGGVWLVRSNGDAVPLSNDWVNQDVSCLAFGPNGGPGKPQVFVGTFGFTRQVVLWVNDPEASDPFFSWIKIPLPDAAMAGQPPGINRIVVFPEERRVVIATQNGLFWANLPTLADVRSNPQSYVWNPVTPDQGLPTGRCFGLAAGFDGTLVVSLPGQGLFHGGWLNANTIRMQAAVIRKNVNRPDWNPAAMQETPVDSCAADRQVLYAVANGDGTDQQSILAVLSSSDGGAIWKELAPELINDNRSLTEAAGDAGRSNNCIGISPVDTSVVAIGWRSGPFVSRDGGQTWRAYDDRITALHGDLHALRFNPTGKRLYIGSDGGIVSADVSMDDPNHNVLGNFITTYNMHLANHQFGSWGLGRSTWATFSVNSGLVGGGLQDNGNVYCKWKGPNFPTPWRQIANSDGKLNLVLSNGDLIFENNSDVTQVSRGAWDDTASGWVSNEGVIPVWRGSQNFDFRGLTGDITPDRPAEFVAEPVSVRVLRGSFDDSQRILAVAGVSDRVFGLFPDHRSSPSRHWELLGTVNIDAADFINAVASYDGQAILIGTNTGRIFHFRPGSFPAEMHPSPAATVMHLLVNAANAPVLDAYAICFDNARNTGKIIHLADGSVDANQGRWETLGRPNGDPLWDLAVDWSLPRPTLFVTNNIGVFASLDQGLTWFAASDGLPAEPQCEDLRVFEGKLFLGTWGRSAWVADLSSFNIAVRFSGWLPLLLLDSDRPSRSLPSGWLSLLLFGEDLLP
jgi:hypothetical protein